MLKIKDNANLKELEKFGFEKCDDGLYRIESKLDDIDVVDITIAKNRRILIYSEIGVVVLFDLIQAGLVEKVEGK